MSGDIKIMGYSSDELPLWAISSNRARAKERKRRDNNIKLNDNEWHGYLVNGEKRYYKCYQNLPGYLGICRPDFKAPELSEKSVKRLPNAKYVKSGVYVCCYCEVPLTTDNYTKEHLQAKSRNGRNAQSNLRPCCIACNIEKDNLMLHSYIQLLNLKWADSVTGSDEYHTLSTKIKNANRLAKEVGKLKISFKMKIL